MKEYKMNQNGTEKIVNAEIIRSKSSEGKGVNEKDMANNKVFVVQQ